MIVNAEVFQSLKNPVWGLEVSRWSSDKGTKMFWNNTLRVCDLLRRAPRNPILSTAINLVPIVSNISILCPFPSGRHYVHINALRANDYIPLRLFYQPGSYVFVFLRFFDELTKGNQTFLAFYRASLVIRNNCERRRKPGSGK